MIRHAMKYVLTACLAVALIGGFAPVGASAAPAAPAASAAAAPDCTAEQNAMVAAAQVAKKRIAALQAAKKAVKKARKALRQAEGATQKAKAKNKLRAAKAKKRKAVAQKKRSIAVLRAAVAAFKACQAGTDPDPDPGTPGPLQPVCDLGLPQAICDALDGLPLPGGSGGTSPIQPLCDAGLPQAICDAATGLPLPGGGSAIQPLCDAGLPQGICDVAAGGLTTGSLPIPAGLPGLPAFGFPGVPDVAGLDALIGLLAPLTGTLPLAQACGLIDVPIVCDLVAP